MYFFYSGKEALSVLVPGEQYAVTIPTSDRSQRTNNEALYNYIFSPEFEHRKLFQKATSFEPPTKGKVEVPADKPDKGGSD
jgi:hypothetical protein